jgi:hypothetical protein
LRYSQIIGSLLYLAGATRPDISFAINKLSRFTSNPGSDHWCALEHVMRYLEVHLHMDFTILGTLLYLKGIVILTESQMQMRSKPQVDMYSLLVGLQFHGGLISRLF